MKLLLAVAITTFATASWAASTDQRPEPAPNSNPVAQAAAPAAAATAAPAPAPAPTTVTGEAQPTVVQSGNTETSEIIHTVEEEAARSGFQIGADLDHWLGTGTFINPNYYASFTGALSVSPAYSFKVGGVNLRASALGRLIYEYTLPDNPTGRRIAPWDIRLGLSAPAVWKEKLTGIAVSPSIGLTIPTSPESWQAGLITSASAGVSLSRSVGMFDFSASVSGSHGFFTNPQNNLKAPNQKDLQNNLVVVCRTGESVCNSPGMNTEWVVSTGGNVNWRITSALIFSVSYSYIHYWAYGLPVDQYSPQTVDSNGHPVAVGQGQADRTFGVFGLGYDLSDHYNVSVSASTIQTPRTMGANGQAGSFRFPFWAFGNAADNSTTVNFTLSAQY